MTPIPQWAKNLRQKGTEIKAVGEHYYLCKVTSKWDPEKKRARKISGDYLGILTPQGLIPAQHRRLWINASLCSKEFGASWLLSSLTDDIRKRLEIRFPDVWKELYTVSLLRTLRPCSFRYIAERYEHSMLSEYYPGLALSGASVSALLKKVGTRRDAIVAFMKDFLFDEREYLIFDGTGIVSFSKGMDDAQIGYNSQKVYDPQINLLYAFYGGTPSGMPAYYRKFPGNVRDVSAFGTVIAEMGIHDIVVIADKGFGSSANFTDLDSSGLRYIVPLRRNSMEYDRRPLLMVDKSGFGGVFQFNGRPIWYYSQRSDTNHTVMVFLDGELRLKEEKDYLARLLNHHDGYSEQELRNKQCEFGVLVMKTNIGESPERTYHLYKKRVQIEQMFDDYKNLMDLDSSYLQSDSTMEAWCFLNHLGLMACYRVYELLRSTNTLKRYSVGGLLQEYLSGVRIERTSKTWMYDVLSKGPKDVLKNLRLQLPELAEFLPPRNPVLHPQGHIT